MNTRANWQSSWGVRNAPSGQVAGVAVTGPVANWTRVQGALTTAASGTTANLAFSVPITSGNIVVGAMLGISQALLISVTDDKGNQYQFANSGYRTDTALNTVTGFLCAAPLTNGPQTLTFTYQSSAIAWILIEEFSAGIVLPGISVDGSQILINSTLLQTPNFQTLRSNDLLWSASFDSAHTIVGAGWTIGQGNNTQQFSEWRQQPSPTASTFALYGSNTQTWATVFGVAPVVRPSWALRQNQIYRNAVGATTGSISFVKTVASGSIVVGSVAVGANGNISDITSIADDKGNNYTIISPNVNGRALFWSNGALTNGPITITVTSSVSQGIFILVNEFLPPPGTSVFAIDGTPTATSSGVAGTSWTSGSVTTTHNGDLLYTTVDSVGDNSRPANSFSSLNGQGMTYADSFFIQQTSGAVSSQWSTGSGTLNMLGLAAISAS